MDMCRKTLAAALTLLVGIGAAGYVLAQILPVGIDYYYWYWPIPRAWLAGETRLYDEASRQFFSPPWALWMLLPFSMLPIQWGMATLTLVSMAIISGISYTYAKQSGVGRPGVIAVLATVCPYSLELLFVGTLDAWSLLGIYLSYRAIQRQQPWLLGGALILASVRPQHLLFTGLAFLLAIRRWPARTLAQFAVLPVATFLVSMVVFGWDWPLRWFQSYQTLPPTPGGIISTYTMLEIMGVPIWASAPLAVALALAVLIYIGRGQLTQRGFDMLLTVNAVVVPYIRGPSFVVLFGLPWTRLAIRRPRLAAAAYALSLPTLVVPLVWGRLGAVEALDLTFPIVLLGLLVLDARTASKAEPHGIV